MSNEDDAAPGIAAAEEESVPTPPPAEQGEAAPEPFPEFDAEPQATTEAAAVEHTEDPAGEAAIAAPEMAEEGGTPEAGLPAEEQPGEQLPAGGEALELQQDPTAEELGPTDVAELTAEGYQVAEELQGDAAYQPMEEGQLPPSEEQMPAEHQQAYAEDAQQGYDMAAGAQDYQAGQAAEYPPADYAPADYPPVDAQAGDAYGGNVYGAEELGEYGQYGQDAQAAYDPTNAMYGQQQDVAADAAYHMPAEGHTAGAVSGHYQHPAPPAEAARALADQLVAEEREKHEAQMKLEAKAREELEDMILRIEKHFKAEQAARKKAEELLQASIAAEMESKGKVEDVLKKRSQEQRLLEEERAAIKRERMALENMRQDFEGELQAARSEVGKAQEALASSEERIRATEQAERARLEADYQARLVGMQQEMERMREEMGYRTMVMGSELEKWRQQATMTANAVLEAKNDVIERKKELDHTKDKMDKLLEKLYIGRERGIELSGAIASNQRMMSFMPGGVFAPGQMKQGMPGAPMQAWAQQAGQVKLPPLTKQAHQPPHMMQSMMQAKQQHPYEAMSAGMGMGLEYAEEVVAPVSIRRARSSNHLADEAGHNAGDRSPPGYQSDGQIGHDAMGHAAGGNQQYAHVQSKFARDAAEKGIVGKAAKARSKSGRAGGIKAAKPDRFAEAERENSRLAGMGRRWN